MTRKIKVMCLIFIVWVIIIVMLHSCQPKALESIKSNNEEIKVELLFEHDGCKVYRFYDGGLRYYTDCRGNVQWIEKQGKNNTVHVEVETVK